MTEKIALHCVANVVELQSEVLCSLILRVQMLEARIEQIQQLTGRNKRRSLKLRYCRSYKAMP
jgi:hypothetical protein